MYKVCDFDVDRCIICSDLTYVRIFRHASSSTSSYPAPLAHVLTQSPSCLRLLGQKYSSLQGDWTLEAQGRRQCVEYDPKLHNRPINRLQLDAMLLCSIYAKRFTPFAHLILPVIPRGGKTRAKHTIMPKPMLYLFEPHVRANASSRRPSP